MSNAPTDDKLREMISGYMISQVISVTATLGLADLLAKGAMSSEALAKATQTHGLRWHACCASSSFWVWLQSRKQGISS